MPRALPALPPCGSSLDCAQPFTYRAIPRFRKKTSPKKVIPRLRSSCPPIVSSLIFSLEKMSRDLRIFLLLSQHSVFLLLSLRPVFLSVPLTFFFTCHSGLRAGVQVNIDSLATWIPGQARNDKRKQKKLVAPLMAAIAAKG